jgi:hypothetical protein
MKGKPTWKPSGLKAKRWRVSGQARGPGNQVPRPTKLKEWFQERRRCGDRTESEARRTG